MKVILVFLILCFCLNLSSAFPWFNFPWDQPAYPSPSTRRPTSPSTNQQNHLRNVIGVQHQAVITPHKNSTIHSHSQRVINRQQYHLTNTTVAHRQAVFTSNKSSTFRSHSQRVTNRKQYRLSNTTVAHTQRVINRKQYHLTNTTVAHRQAYSINRKSNQTYFQGRSFNNSTAFRQLNRSNNKTNKQITYTRYRPFSSIHKNSTIGVTSGNRRILSQGSLSKSTAAASKSKALSIVKNNIQSFRSRSTVKNTKVSLPRSHGANTTGRSSIQNRRRLQPESYYQQHFRAFYESQSAKNTAHNRSILQAALQQRKRRNDIPFEPINSMIYSRNAPYIERNPN